jgi:hypothetical protein
MLFAVFLVRGALPWLIIWASVPSLGPIGALTATFSGDPIAETAIEASAPLLLMGGGVFLLLIFMHWLFLEKKRFGLPTEEIFFKNGVWFFAIASIVLCLIVWLAMQQSSMLAFAAVVGSTGFFITHGFRQNAEQAEKRMLNSNLSDVSKVFYLEILDTTFSIDGVIGAFAFTLSVPLILLGNGLGAVVVRQMTVRNIERIKKYAFLKNGAMYSVFFLGLIMISDGFGVHVPIWLSPLVTFGVLGYFFWKSKKHLVKNKLRRKSG